MSISAQVAVIGGSGLYALFAESESQKHTIATPYGPATVTLGVIDGRDVAFLTRHGADHSVAPHLINYRANVWALASLGVRAIVSSAAVGGVNPEYPAGTLVLTDQFIDRTSGRADTFYDRGSVQHLPAADPFCPTLHEVAIGALDAAVRHSGTVVVIQGPRFSTRAESLWFRAAGADIVNMTLYPEVPLAAELNIGTVNLAYVTDADAAPADEQLTSDLVFARFAEAQPRIVAALTAIVAAIPADYAGRELIDPAEVAAVLARGHGMTLLVTGGAGFIGGAIVSAALDAGVSIRVLDSLRADVHGATPQFDDRLDVRIADVRDADAVADALDGVEVVCHQAAKVGLGVDFSDAPDYVGSNELGTAVLLAAMTAAGVRRLVFASSMVVYGEGAYSGASGPARPAARAVADLDAGRFDPLDADGGPLVPTLIDEDAPLDPRNVYAATKLGQEHLASSWARATGGSAVALRYHNVYGPGMPQNTPYAGVASLFRSAIERGEAPRVFEDGLQRRDFVHVRDVATANLAALEWTAQHPGEFRAYNVGSGEVHTIGELAAELSVHAGGLAPVVTGEYRLGDVRHITASSARLRAELGWAPAMSFTEGMREFATAPLRAAVS